MSDDGCGLDLSNVPTDRLGLGIIREHVQVIGAELNIETHPGHDNSIAVTWEEEQ